MKNPFNKLFILSFIILAFSGCNLTTIDSQQAEKDSVVQTENQESQTAIKKFKPIEGDWIISNDIKTDWFAIRIIENKDKADYFDAYLIEEGSLKLNNGVKLLEFHAVGAEYWGKIRKNDLPPNPCRILLDIVKQEICIKEERLYSRETYRGIKSTPISQIIDGSLANASIHSGLDKEFQASNLELNKKISSYSLPSSGYGEISSITGRPKTVAVKGYHRKDGTYVKPHYRSSPRR